MILFLLNTLLFVVGLSLLAIGFRWYRFGRLVRDTPTAKPGSAAAGRVEVNGSVVPDGEPLTVPFTGEECVYLDWTVEEQVDGEWIERESETQVAPFYLDGERGQILVRADKHPEPSAFPSEYESILFDDAEEVEEIETFLGEYRSRDRSGRGTRTNPATTENPAAQKTESENSWQIRKKLLPTGTDLYVFGEATLQHDRSEIAIETDGSTEKFIVNRSHEEFVATRARGFALLTVTAGLLFTVWGGLSLIGLL
jgi:hypothetical protein